MDKQKHGLADAQDGEFILNESGTSVSTDKVEFDEQVKNKTLDPAPGNEEKEKLSSGPHEKTLMPE